MAKKRIATLSATGNTFLHYRSEIACGTGMRCILLEQMAYDAANVEAAHVAAPPNRQRVANQFAPAVGENRRTIWSQSVTGRSVAHGIAVVSRVNKSVSREKNFEFDPDIFLTTAGVGRKILTVSKKQGIYTQGDAADAVFYIQSGKISLTVVSAVGKEATIGMLSEGSFFGEGSLAGQPLRMGSAMAMTDCQLLRIGKKVMTNTLRREHSFSDMFMACLLARNIRYEEDLVDHLFNSSEKRLARILLLMARFGKEGVPETMVPKLSQETLAEMVGTTRSRVSFFMNRFRKSGFIEYAGGLEGGLQVHSSLLNVVLQD